MRAKAVEDSASNAFSSLPVCSITAASIVLAKQDMEKLNEEDRTFSFHGLHRKHDHHVIDQYFPTYHLHIPICKNPVVVCQSVCQNHGRVAKILPSYKDELLICLFELFLCLKRCLFQCFSETIDIFSAVVIT